MIKLNDRGSTLATVLIAIMLVTIATTGFLSAVNGMAHRSIHRYEEKQVYLSARSAAYSIAKLMEENSYNQIMSLESGIRNRMTSLPLEMQVGESSNIILTNAQQNLLNKLNEINEGTEIDLGTISWVNTPANLDMGVVSVRILKEDSDRYLVEARATLAGEEWSVKTLLTGTFHEISAEPDVNQDSELNWSGLYSELGIDTKNGTIITDEGNKIVTNTLTVQSVDKGQLITKEPVILYHQVLAMGNITTESVLLIEETTIDSGLLYAQNNIVVKDNTYLATAMESSNISFYGESIHIDSGNVGSNLYAQDIVIEGNNIQIDMDIICETLSISGTNISINSDVQLNQINVSGNAVYVKDHYVEEPEIDNLEDDQTPDSTVNTEEADINIVEIKYEQTTQNYDTRYKPSWASYQVEDLKIFKDSEKMKGGTYYLDTTVMDTIEVRNNVLVNDAYTIRQDTYHTINLVDYIEVSEVTVDNPLIIILRNNQKINVEGLSNIPYVYFVLEGNAKLRVTEGHHTMRVYGEPISQTLNNEIYVKMNNIISGQEDYKTINLSAKVSEVQKIKDQYYDKINVLESPGEITLSGTAIVNYIKIENGNFIWNKQDYNPVSSTINSLDIENSIMETKTEGYTGTSILRTNTSNTGYRLFTFIEFTK